MKRVVVVALAVLGALAPAPAFAAGRAPADSVRVLLRALAADGRPVEGASVAAGAHHTATGAGGEARLAVPAGLARITVTRLGYAPDTLRIVLLAGRDTALVATLREQALEVAPILVTSLRTLRRLEDEPERVEVLAGEDVDEKSQTRPGDLKQLLGEISGVRVQATAPGLGAAGLRIQGLRGQYTEVLADGLPLYGASAPEFGLVQLPPLDLAQAEVIKGAASALYGPAALGGVLDLVSRRPTEGRPERTLLANRTSRDGGDGTLWLARRAGERWGWTLLGGAHGQAKTDVDGDRWADLPGYVRGELRPRAFWNGAGGRSVMATAGAMAENRTGGATALASAGFPAAEGLDTRRGDAGLVARLPCASAGVLSVLASASFEWRHVLTDAPATGAVPYRERRRTLFAEATWLAANGPLQWVVAGSIRHDTYRNDVFGRLAYAYADPALMAHATLTANPWLSASASGRLDAHSRFGTIASPRVSLLAHAGHALEARVSAGTGFSAPTPFTEETQAIRLARLVTPAGLVPERARSASFDLTGRRGPFELNGTVFASELRNAVLLDEAPSGLPGMAALVNVPGPARTRGAELFAVFNREPVLVTVYQAWLAATEVAPGSTARRTVPLSPAHSSGLDVAWEEDESGTRVGLEAFYTGRQSLEHDPSRAASLPYWTLAVLVSQKLGPALVYVNADNLTDVRQTRWEPLLLPAPGPGGRITADAWAPLEGRVFNAGVRLAF